MIDVVNIEWRNENRLRRYPFADGASLLSDDGRTLSDSAFLDAMVYPFAAGTIYLSRIDTVNAVVQLSAGGVMIAEAAIVPGGDVLEFLDSYGRRIGTMIAGPGLVEVAGTATFAEDAAPLCQACVLQQVQESVNGFLLPDGTIVSGNVIFAGVDGVRIVTYTDVDGVRVLRLDAVGVPDVPDCVDLPDPIKCIDVRQAEESDLTISRDGAHILIGHRSELAEVCTNRDRLPADDGTLPLNTPCDPCATWPCPPEGPCPPVPPGPGPGSCPPDPQRYFISVVGDLAIIEPHFGAGMAAQVMIDDAASGNLPAREAQGVLLRLRGVEP